MERFFSRMVSMIFSWVLVVSVMLTGYNVDLINRMIEEGIPAKTG